MFARDLQRALEATYPQCLLRMRSACHAKPSNGASLRAMYDGNLGFSYIHGVHWLSSGATHRISPRSKPISPAPYTLLYVMPPPFRLDHTQIVRR